MAEGEITIVGSDSHFKGELSFDSTAKINGKFDGQIHGKGELLVNNNALCKADVNVGAAQVNGKVEGNLTAKDTITLNTNGSVKGDITAAKMVMAEGASFHGLCAVGPDAPSSTPSSAQPTPAPTGSQSTKK